MKEIAREIKKDKEKLGQLGTSRNGPRVTNYQWELLGDRERKIISVFQLSFPQRSVFYVLRLIASFVPPRLDITAERINEKNDQNFQWK